MENSKKTLSNCLGERSTNLQFIRFIAALLVIISHAFPLSEGIKSFDFFAVYSNQNYTFGALAVAIFFFISGFYAVRSVTKYKTWHLFLKKKVLRIFPMLIIVVLICTFILGPFVTKLSLLEYFSNTETYQYVLNGILILQHNLPGVFDMNIYGGVVNGALWTMPIEFLCIIGCFVMYKLTFLKKKMFLYTIPFVLFSSLVVIILNGKVAILDMILMPCLMFYIGMAAYVFREKVILNKKIFLFFLILLIILCSFKYMKVATVITLPYIIMYLSFGIKQHFKKLEFLGDTSYEMYLLGFPIQQTIVFCFGGQMYWLHNVILAIPLCILFSLLIKYFYKHCMQKIVY